MAVSPPSPKSPAGQRAAREAASAGPTRPSVDEAIAVLRDAVDSPRAQAALKTLEGELEHRGPENRMKTQASEGRQGFPSKGDVRSQLGGQDSAKGDTHSPPFLRRGRKARAATARGGY